MIDIKKILVVDDEEEDLTSMKEILQEAGYKVIAANNGADALDFVERDMPNLVLIDIMMPTLSGYDLLRLMRQRIDHKIKMVYVSIVPKNKVDMDGIDGFVQKPFSPNKLLTKVKEVLK